jgi:glycosyltransferase involved in cell wall biosynthesis
MRIAIVTHVVAFNDGQGRVNYEIARTALEAGAEVTLLATHVAPELAAHPSVRWEKIDVARWPSRVLQYQVFALRSAWRIRRLRHRLDIVHVNGFISWARADVNTAHFVHDGWYRCGFYPFALSKGLYSAYQRCYTWLNQHLEKWAFRRARVVVPVSRKIAAEIEALGIGRGRLKVIHNGVDPQEFAPGPAARQSFGLPDAAFMLLFAGDLRIPRKNLDTVLHALADTPAHIHLAVAGGLKDSTYPALVDSLGLGQRVHFLGMIKDMAGLMRSVDTFVFPSRYEAMSLVLLEALAAGLPVVTAQTAGGAEIIDADCGLVVDDPDDRHAIAHAITRLAEDPALAAAMGVAARTLALRFSWQAMGENYLALYRELMAAPREVRPGASSPSFEQI